MENGGFMDVITMLYSVTGLITLSAFIPQLVALLKDKTASVSLNLSTWGLFSTSSMITLMYACSHNGDTHFIVCSAIGAAGNASILFTAIFRRFQCVELVPSRAFSVKK